MLTNAMAEPYPNSTPILQEAIQDIITLREKFNELDSMCLKFFNEFKVTNDAYDTGKLAAMTQVFKVLRAKP